MLLERNAFDLIAFFSQCKGHGMLSKKRDDQIAGPTLRKNAIESKACI